MSKIKLILVLVLAAIGFFVYRSMPPHRKMQLRFALKQLPSLPGRYMV